MKWQSPSRPAQEPGFLTILAAVKRPDVLWNVPIHLFILIPATSVIAWLATRLDAHLGWAPVTSAPGSIAGAVVLFTIGILIVWYSYGYLAIMGEGSPATHLGGTQRLVTTGIFSVCRHPSIIGKFVGVLGLGVLVGSPFFLFVVIPLLTTYSLLSVRYWQERLCDRLWGEDYARYRRDVPLVMPRPKALLRFLFSRS